MKILPNGIAVLKNDTHISKWVEEHGRLDHDRWLLDQIEPYLHEGDWVVDAGAFIGDHALAYAKKVGLTGRVFAFEPNRQAFDCLCRNIVYFHVPNIIPDIRGLTNDSEQEFYALEEGPHSNAGMAFVKGRAYDLGIQVTDINMRAIPLDDLYLERLDFLKMDIEGYEHKALIGAKKTICKFHPIILLEINKEALARNDSSFAMIQSYLKALDYTTIQFLQPHVNNLNAQEELQFDALFFHEPKRDL